MESESTLNPDAPEGISELFRHNARIEVTELDKSGNVQRKWLHSIDATLTEIHDESNNGLFPRGLHERSKAVFDAFLPVGYPHSVSDDYFAYQFFDSLQAFFSTITSLLANRALLQGLGVGDADSSATFAMLLTIFKDGMSRVATILFAQRFGLRIEPDAKRYRFLADVFNDSAFFLELYSPYLGSVGKVVALSIGEALRALCGVAAGASKAALSVHFAKHDNLAELNAKEASQETAVGLVGLLVGTIVVKSIEDHSSVVMVMIVLVLGHLVVNYLGVRSVCMSTLNRQRATILIENFYKTGKFLNPAEVAARESIVFWEPLVLSTNGRRMSRIEMAEDYAHAIELPPGSTDLVVLDGWGSSICAPKQLAGGVLPIRILLHEGVDAQPRRVIAAWAKAIAIAWNLDDTIDSPDNEWWMSQFHHIGGHDKEITKEGAEELAKDDDPSVRNLLPWTEMSEFWETLSRLGWDIETQAFETRAPVRLRVQPAKHKGV